MRRFRKFVHGPIGSIVTSFLVAATLHSFSEPYNYLYALEVERAKEHEIRAIAKRMNVDPEFLLHPGGRRSFDFKSLFDWVTARLGITSDATVTDAQPSDVQSDIARVKARYALVAADTTLAKLASLLDVALSPDNVRAKKKGQIKSELQSVLRLVDKDFLPPLLEGLPGSASSRDAQMRSAQARLRQDVKAVINAPHALDDKNIDATLARLRETIGTSIKTKGNGQPRWTRDPFPVKDHYQTAPKVTTGPQYGSEGNAGTDATMSTPAVVTNAAAPPVQARVVSNAIAGDVAALAAQLGTPAKAFAFVYDNIDFVPYSGVAKGARGALHERAANDWDQALLLRDLLQSQGYQAQIEWGKVDLPIARAMNLAGTEDPIQAANLLATAGYDAVALTQNGTPIIVRMTHAWVRAFIPYIPNRGTTNGTADTWVRMDPSFKRYEYQAGIAIDAPWSESEYLQTSTVRPPNDFYADKVWAYIRSHNLNCNNLSQVAKSGRIKAANFPFVPATLNARIESLGGLGAEPPASMLQTVTLSVTDPYFGDEMTRYSTTFASLWGRKLSITFPPATPEDAATIAAYGGIYNTPAYLVHLKAVISIDDQPVAQGGSVAAGADVSLDLSFTEPRLGTDTTHHDITAGETMTQVFDSGRTPDSLIAERMERLKTIAAQPVSDAQKEAMLTEKLSITGMRYMQEVDDGFDFATGTTWHRWVKSTFEGLVSQRVNTSYNFVGQAVRITPADRNIDVTRVIVGIIPIGSDTSGRINTMTLAGLHASYLEGAIWEEMEAQQGISATKALLLARIAGQTIRTADRSNIDSVLAAINLSAEAEANIRGAVSQGRIAIVPSANIRVNKWVGTGYILRDPIGGSATYPISGGFAGGSSTGAGTDPIDDYLGSEEWLDSSPWGYLIRYLQDEFGGGKGGDSAPSTTQSDPVNVANGNMIQTYSDVNIATISIPVTISRTYNSRSTYNGPLGYGWIFNYDEAIVRNADGSVTYREGDGSEHDFTRNADGTYAPPAGKHLTLVPSGAGFLLTLKEGAEFTFDANGRLISQRDLNGNVLRIDRDAAGLPTAIIDASGRTALTFTVNAGKITAITDIGGRTVSYGYEGDDLVTFTDATGKVYQFAYDLQHNLTDVTDPAGHHHAYDYDTDDRMFHHTDANGAEEFLHYDVAGRKSVVTDKIGGDRLVQYDDRARATMQVDQAGNMVRATYDDDNNRTAVVDSRGNVSTYEYDDDGNMIKSTSPDGGVMTATYGDNGRVLTETSETGLVTSYSYDTAGNVTEIRRVADGVTEVSTNTYDARGNILTMTGPNGGVTTMTWGETGIPATQTDPTGATYTFNADALGRVTSVVDPAGNTTTLSYDDRDRLTSMKDAHGQTMTLTYDDSGRRTSLVTPLGTMRYAYDAEGRLVSMTDMMGNTNTRTYDAAGRVLATTDGRGVTMKYEYDAVGRVVRSIDGNGGVWSFDYCAGVGSTGCASCSGGSDSTFCLLVDPSGKAVKQEFDTMGRVIKAVDALGNTSSAQYDSAGRKTAVTDANGNTTRYTYDQRGNLLSVTDAAGGVTEYTYDAFGNKLTQKDAKGSVWSFQYDLIGRMIASTDPLQHTTSFTYDALGNLKTKTDGNGKTTTFTYDIRRLMSVAFGDGTTESYSYDQYGRRTGMSNANASFAYTYDALNRVTSFKNVTYNLTVSYAYDAAGNWKSMTTPQSTVQYTYDGKNRLASINDSFFGTFRFDYDAMDRRIQLHYPNGTAASYQYDANSQLSAVMTKDAAGIVLDAWSYTYDAAGNRTSRTNIEGQSETYTYDALHRLTAAVSGSKSERFTYDAVGNRIARIDQTGTTTTYSYDVAHQLIQAGSDVFAYDQNGNMRTRTSPRGVTTLTYDLADRVVGISGPDGNETNLYAPDGNRIDMAGSSIENGRVRVFHDLVGNPILDWGIDNRTWTYRLYGPKMDEVLAEYRRPNNRTTYMHHDGSNSVTLVTSSAGVPLYRASFSAFGEMTRTSDGSGIPPTRLGYTGREISVGSLMQYRARYYDTSLGRFTSQDPYPASDDNPATLNRYAYVQNNPMTYNDPLGLYCANPSPTGQPYVGIGVNRPSPSVDTMDWSAPGLCIYMGPIAINPYLDFTGNPYNLDGLGTGWLFAPHINIKTYRFVVTGKGGFGGYGKKAIGNIHIGMWASSTHVCFIIDDPISGSVTPVHFRMCIPKWLIYAIAVIILCVLLWYLAIILAEVLAAWGGAEALGWALGGLAFA